MARVYVPCPTCGKLIDARSQSCAPCRKVRMAARPCRECDQPRKPGRQRCPTHFNAHQNAVYRKRNPCALCQRGERARGRNICAACVAVKDAPKVTRRGTGRIREGGEQAWPMSGARRRVAGQARWSLPYTCEACKRRIPWQGRCYECATGRPNLYRRNQELADARVA